MFTYRVILKNHYIILNLLIRISLSLTFQEEDSETEDKQDVQR